MDDKQRELAAAKEVNPTKLLTARHLLQFEHAVRMVYQRVEIDYTDYFKTLKSFTQLAAIVKTNSQFLLR